MRVIFAFEHLTEHEKKKDNEIRGNFALNYVKAFSHIPAHASHFMPISFFVASHTSSDRNLTTSTILKNIIEPSRI